MTNRMVTFVCMVAAVLLVTPAFAGGEVAIGDEMPDFTMKDYNGETHSLSDYRGKIVVLDFVSQHCPWSKGSDADMARISKTYQDKDVVFLGIDSHKTTSPADIKEYAEDRLPHPILKDSYNDYADLAGASRTPELFVLDADGKLAYHGAFDNREAPQVQGDVNYLTNALDALIAGKDVSVTEKSAWGCAIKRFSAAEKQKARESTD